jgi:hypothetical protein
MRSWHGLLTGLIAVGLAGCTISASGPAAGPPPAVGPATSPAAVTGSAAAPAGPAEPMTRAGARAAAANFYQEYAASQFAASWDLLAPAAKRTVTRDLWVGVHQGCLPASGGSGRVIRSVIVFGNSAIVTETRTGTASRLGKAEDVFSYVDGHWGYAPDDLAIYQHGSVGADIAAARAVGFCSNQKAAPL